MCTGFYAAPYHRRALQPPPPEEAVPLWRARFGAESYFQTSIEGIRMLNRLLTALIVLGVLASLVAAVHRFQAEGHNRRVEIGLEYAEVDTLAQSSGRPLPDLLRDLKAQNVGALVLNEDTLSSLETTGAARPFVQPSGSGGPSTVLEVDDPRTLARIREALAAHGISPVDSATGGTRFALVAPGFASHTPLEQTLVRLDYAHLRSLGLGLPPEAVKTTTAAGLSIVGRIANFPGVTPTSARAVLAALRAQGATLVIFVGDDLLGYRGMEKEVANLLRSPGTPPLAGMPDTPPIGLRYGEVEFGKQRGESVLVAALRGDYVRVHAIQTAEMGQMDENAIIDRYALAARERNIRFCYVRLLTNAGADAVAANTEFLRKISRRIARGGKVTAGGLEFGAARPFEKVRFPTLLFGLMGLGVAAGAVWMLRELAPISDRAALLLLGASLVVCAGLGLAGQSGRTLVALLAGIAFPTIACLRAYPRPHDEAVPDPPLPPAVCVSRALRTLGSASAVTLIGIVHVIGLLASREFMVKASQFLGIKAQHGVPILLVAFVALIGGVQLRGETWVAFRDRALGRLRAALDEPARYGLLLLGLVALAMLVLILARTGNDSGVAVSGAEMKGRALLDRLLPVRPRTKEFLIGHPAFVLALAWWWRGRRRLAIPCYVVGSIGQVSLLNTFCHIHTPEIASLWRGGLGLIVGAAIGVALFLVLERFLPAPGQGPERRTRGARPAAEAR